MKKGAELRGADKPTCADTAVHGTAAGRERFRIVRVLEEKPVLVCEVEYLPTVEEPTEEVGERAFLPFLPFSFHSPCNRAGTHGTDWLGR